MSSPSSRMRPEVARRRPEIRLKRDVLPAPFGPITPRNSPSATSSETSATIVAPPMSSPSSSMARIGAGATIPKCRCGPEELLALEARRDRRRRLVGAGGPEHLGRPDVLHLLQGDAEHRLQHRVILRPDRLPALRREELPAL